jgi:hypothetical protein
MFGATHVSSAQAHFAAACPLTRLNSLGQPMTEGNEKVGA